MDPQSVFCPNLACAARGQVGKANVGVHQRAERRYICHVCQQTFSASKGTPLYRLHTNPATMSLVVALLSHGCPVPAIVFAFGLTERTVRAWEQRVGQHCAQVQQHLVEQPRDLGQVQADELRVKQQGQIVWVAMAIQVATRLWLGAVVSEHRDGNLLAALLARVRRCALCRPLLFCVDGFSGYVRTIRETFREAIPTGGSGRPALRAWDGIQIAQVVKQYAGRRVCGVVRRIVQGTAPAVQSLLQATQGGGVINTAYIERLNATFRSRLAGLGRRGRGLLQHCATLTAGLYLVGTVYNFCTPHESLRVGLYVGRRGRRHWVPRTPAMAAGITAHCWTIQERLHYQVPPSRWTPPKRRGRVSKATQELIKRWC